MRTAEASPTPALFQNLWVPPRIYFINYDTNLFKSQLSSPETALSLPGFMVQKCGKM